MNAAAFDGMTEIIDDAIDVADNALRVAKEAAATPASPASPASPAPPAPQVTLTKVASEKYESVAKAISETGSYPGKSVSDIAKNLREAGEGGLLAIMEKMASTAIFPLDGSNLELGGDLVDKLSPTGVDTSAPRTKSQVWQDARNEVKERYSH